jgi:hypothetical protein
MVRPPSGYGIYIIVLLLLVFAVVGFFVYHILFPEKKSSSWTYKNIEKQENYSQYLQNQEIIAEKQRQTYIVAVDTLDSGLCVTIEEKLLQSRCQDAVVAAKALKGKDGDLCKGIQDQGLRDRCQDNVSFQSAEERRDSSLCQSLVDENLKLQCTETIQLGLFQEAIHSGATFDEKLCQTFSGSIYDRCMARIVVHSDSDAYRKALTSKSLSDCEFVRDESTKIRCRDALYFDIAARDGEFDACGQIVDEERRTYCTTSIQSQKDATLYRMIIRDGEITSCQDIVSEALRKQCHDMVIVREVRINQDVSPCDNLYNTGLIFGCKNSVRQ